MKKLKEPDWKKCSRCDDEVSRLSENGLCQDCENWKQKIKAGLGTLENG